MNTVAYRYFFIFIFLLITSQNAFSQQKGKSLPIIVKTNDPLAYAKPIIQDWKAVPGTKGLFYRISAWPYVMEQKDSEWGNCSTQISRIDIESRVDKRLAFRIRFKVNAASCDGPDKPLSITGKEIVFEYTVDNPFGKEAIVSKEIYFFEAPFLPKTEFFRIVEDKKVTIDTNSELVFPGPDSSSIIEDQQNDVNSYIKFRSNIIAGDNCSYRNEQMQAIQKFQTVMDAKFKNLYDAKASGKKVSACPHCMGRGTRYCMSCLETFGKTCTACNGNGYVQCQACHGGGCYACNNTGSVKCSDCRGCGTYFGKDYECNYIGLNACPWCEGTGLSIE